MLAASPGEAASTTALPLLVVLGLLQFGGHDSAAVSRPSVLAVATVRLDEAARSLSGSLRIRIRSSPERRPAAILLDTGTAHVVNVRANGVRVEAEADDGLGLRVPVPAGPRTDSILVELDFAAADTAEPSGSTRRFDFRGWMPRVLEGGAWPVPALADVLIVLDAPADQIIGASGIPLCGDPGWAAARRFRRPEDPGVLKRDSTAVWRARLSPRLPADACRDPGEGLKRVVWFAANVRDVALAMDPAFRYEKGDLLWRPVHLLYSPGDERTWGAGTALNRTETALAWLHEMFDGPAPRDYPWPQTTTVHAAGSGGAAEPMLVEAPSPDQEEILLQLGRLYLGTIVAVAPPDRVWLEDGLTAFQSDLFLETQGRRGTWTRLERRALEAELDGRARPVLAGAAPADDASRERARFLFHKLRATVGDSVVREILRAYWAHARLRTADESLFVAVADSVAPDSLGTRFAASLRDASLVDYAVGAVRRERLTDGRWRTIVEVRRKGGGHFPVEVKVVTRAGTASARVSGIAQRETVSVETAARATRVDVDPTGRSHDWNVLNNRRTLGALSAFSRPTVNLLDPYFSRPYRRDRLARAWAPVGWYNDGGGWTVGLRRRDDYLDRFDLDELWVNAATGGDAPGARPAVDARLVVKNPTWLQAPGVGERLELARVEGRAIAALSVEKAVGGSTAGLALAWVGALTSAYLDPSRYERAGTLEMTATWRTGWSSQVARAEVAGSLAGGYASRKDSGGVRSGDGYGRVTAGASADRAIGRFHLRGRAWAGAVLARGVVPRQRLIYLAGADPYELLDDPFLRSRGSILARGEVHYQAPGGAGLRGFSPGLAARQAYGSSLEIEVDLARGGGGLARRIAVAAFADGALADGDIGSAGLANGADAGIGLRLDHRIGATSFQTRLDLPLWVSRPELAQDAGPARKLGFRWAVSFSPAF